MEWSHGEIMSMNPEVDESDITFKFRLHYLLERNEKMDEW